MCLALIPRALAMGCHGLARALIVLIVIHGYRDLDHLHEVNFALANRWEVIKLLNGTALVIDATHLALMAANR